VDIEDVRAKAGQGTARARFMYVLPNFQNPTGRTMSEARRAALSEMRGARDRPAAAGRQPLWRPVVRHRTAAAGPDRAQPRRRHLHGLVLERCWHRACAWVSWWHRKAVYPKLLQAKQAADLHTPGFNQRIVSEVMKDGFHGPACAHHPRAVQGSSATRCSKPWTRELPARPSQSDDERVVWNKPSRRHVPVGAPARRCMNAVDLLPRAVEHGVAFVPGRTRSMPTTAITRTLRLSFVTPSAEEIRTRRGRSGAGHP
jgi:2-aminoadipate transaminase